MSSYPDDPSLSLPPPDLDLESESDTEQLQNDTSTENKTENQKNNNENEGEIQHENPDNGEYEAVQPSFSFSAAYDYNVNSPYALSQQIIENSPTHLTTNNAIDPSIQDNKSLNNRQSSILQLVPTDNQNVQMKSVNNMNNDDDEQM